MHANDCSHNLIYKMSTRFPTTSLSYHTLESSMRKARSRSYPALPATLEEFEELLRTDHRYVICVLSCTEKLRVKLFTRFVI